MKSSVVIASAILTLGTAISIQFAGADTLQANCEVRKNGETKQGKSGACSWCLVTKHFLMAIFPPRRTPGIGISRSEIFVI